MLATSSGQSIRVPVDGISFRSRGAGGVRVFNTGAGEEVVSVAWIADQGEDEADDTAPDTPDESRSSPLFGFENILGGSAQPRRGADAPREGGAMPRRAASPEGGANAPTRTPCPRPPRRITSPPMTETLHIVGGGMAGSEAAWQAAEAGVPVIIHEMRPQVGTFAHRTGNLAEMVCSNSFRSDDDEQNAVGLLHWEMRPADGLIMAMADAQPCPRAARWPWTATLRRGRDRAGCAPIRWSPSEPGEIDAPARGRPLDHRDRPADLRRAGRGDPRRDRRRTRWPSSTPSRPSSMPTAIDMDEGLVPVALRQGRDRGGAHRLPQLPDGPRPVRGLHRRAARRRQDRVPRGRDAPAISTAACRSR